MLSNLRTYQLEGISNIFRKWQEGLRSVLFQMPTGTGKTVLFSEIVRRGFLKERKILIVVHRKELVAQITDKLKDKEVDVGIIMAGEKGDANKIVQVASIQTLTKREHPEANLIIIDESHHAKANSYKKLWEIYPDAKFLGVTATPVRLTGEGFDDLFDCLITSMPVQEFIKQGFLVPIAHYVCSNPDLSNIKQRKGDYETKMLSNVMMDDSVMSDLVENYMEKCKGKSMIVFAVDVDHSKEITERYISEGIPAAHIDAKTPPSERKQILDDFKNKKITVVSNVEIITEGFDFPECEVVQLARPTKSLSLYLQMVGRVMRTAQGKNEGIVLDNASLWLEHGISTIDREWDLKGLGKKSKKGREIDMVAINDNEELIGIERTRLPEIKGLKLIPLTLEFERLLIFEGLLSFARTRNFKLLKTYNDYLAYLADRDLPLTNVEFEYIQKRLNHLNQKVSEDKRFNTGFWYHQAKDLGLNKPKWKTKGISE